MIAALPWQHCGSSASFGHHLGCPTATTCHSSLLSSSFNHSQWIQRPHNSLQPLHPRSSSQRLHILVLHTLFCIGPTQCGSARTFIKTSDRALDQIAPLASHLDLTPQLKSSACWKISPLANPMLPTQVIGWTTHWQTTTPQFFQQMATCGTTPSISTVSPENFNFQINFATRKMSLSPSTCQLNGVTTVLVMAQTAELVANRWWCHCWRR